MSDIFDVDDDAAGGNAPPLSVSQVSGAVKRTLEDAFGRVRVRGEVGRVSRPRSGHVYLDLKDDRATLASVVWKGQAAKLDLQPEEGDEVVAEGRLTTFPGQSKYQLIIDRLSYAGAGALLAKLERLKAALASEGLFAPERKRRPPFLPRTIGVVTSPSGAVIRDILHRLGERYPCHVLVWPVAVQGATCAGEVAAAVKSFNALAPDGPIPPPDVLIVARGGGSVEDLWGFNEEIVVRAVADSAIPVISAVGHETDTTLIDFAADLRAPTPTAAAELAAPVRADLLATIAAMEDRRGRAFRRGFEERARRLRDMARALPSPDALLASPRQRLDRAAETLPQALRGLTATKRAALLGGPAGRFGPVLLRAARMDAATALREAGGRLARAASDKLRIERQRLKVLAPLLEPRLAARATERRRAFTALAARLTPQKARAIRARGVDRLTGVASRLARAATQAARARQARLTQAGALLETLSHKATLARGFALALDPAGAPIKSVAAVSAGQALTLRFHDGDVAATAQAGAAGPSPAGAGGARKGPARPAPRRRGPGGQGSLF